MILYAADIIDPSIGIHYQLTKQSAITTLPHKHDFYEVFLVTEGDMEHVVNGQSTELTVNQLVFIHPNDEHFYKDIKGSILNLAFTAEIYELINKFMQIDYLDVKTIAEPDTVRCLMEIQDIFSLSPTDLKLSVRLKRLLIYMLSLFAETVTSVSGSSWLDALIDEMNKPENFIKGLNRMYQLSPKSAEHTTRMFKKATGITPTAHINNLRLQYAKNLLLTTDKSVTEICFDVGFYDTSYFYVCFKKAFNTSPTKYRKENRKLLIL